MWILESGTPGFRSQPPPTHFLAVLLGGLREGTAYHLEFCLLIRGIKELWFKKNAQHRAFTLVLFFSKKLNQEHFSFYGECLQWEREKIPF